MQHGNAVETTSAELKAALRSAAARTVEALWATIGRIVASFTPAECANYLAAAGYDSD
jgi:hypothetical protein